MKKMARLFAFFLFLSSIASAQLPDSVAIKSVVDRLFEGMRKGDSSLIHSTFTADASLQTVLSNREGQTSLQTEPLDSFLAAIARPHAQTYDERIRLGEVRIDGSLAVVWAPYEFFLGSQFSHCGVDVFQLMKRDGEWKIFHLVDTRRRQGCR